MRELRLTWEARDRGSRIVKNHQTQFDQEFILGVGAPWL